MVKQNYRKYLHWIFLNEKIVAKNYICQKILLFKKCQKIENYYLLKQFENNLAFDKESKKMLYYHISADTFIKNNIAYDFKIDISFMSKWKIF